MCTVLSVRLPVSGAKNPMLISLDSASSLGFSSFLSALYSLFERGCLAATREVFLEQRSCHESL